MTDHYFARKPTSTRRPIDIAAEIRGRSFRFRSDAGVFSATRVDPGTRLLAEVMEIRVSDHVLDLGCGYGVLGIVAAGLAPEGMAVLLDRNARAIELARANIALNGIANAHTVLADSADCLADNLFHVVVTNPPVHAGNRAVFGFIEAAHRTLLAGGWFYLVGRMRRGVATFARRMERTFGDVTEVKKKAGYRVYRSQRREKVA
ncbi:MAG: class I SAM-dependent methyltransferase [Armatimonadota bacterium]|nr:MAG: class I SAM-dependent methyltransferase [Armatimonadota bacterium]